MKRVIIVALITLLIVPAACRRRQQRIVIGIALTAGYHPAARLAANEINSSGGIGGVPVELMGLDWQVVDNNFEAQDILKWAGQFADEQDLVAVIGHSDSTSTLSAASYYNQHKVPQIVTIATNPAITNIGDWTYRLCLSDAAQGPALADYAIRDWGKRRVAVFYVNDDYGRGLAKLFEQRVREDGGEIISSIMHRNVLKQDDKELIRSTLAGLKEKEPDLVVLFQRLGAVRFTIQEIQAAGLDVSILGGDSLGPTAFAKKNSPLVEGIRLAQFFQPRTDDARVGQFLKNFRQFAGHDADYGDAFAYDAVYLVRDAIAGGGSSREGVKSYLDRVIRERTQQSGVAGAYLLGPDHDARRELFIVEVHDGAQTLLKSLRVD